MQPKEILKEHVAKIVSLTDQQFDYFFSRFKQQSYKKGQTIIAEGDKVVARVTMTGTHTGDFWGVPPTGRKVNLTAIYIVRIADGKIVEHWGEEDGMKVFRQLGFKLKLEELVE